MEHRKTALYIRVARADDDLTASQEKMMLSFAVDKGYCDVAVYSDNGASGLTLNRPGMNALMNDVRNGKVQTLLAKDSSRFARDYNNYYKLLDELDSQGVTIVTFLDGIVPTQLDNTLKCLLSRQTSK